MERTVIQQLKAWKASPRRKPLIVMGARQVGKTYILKKFGETEYDNVAYINCDDNTQAATLFANDYDIQRVILAISAITGESILPGKTLIILDEIQELKRGLSALKYFCENAPGYHVAVAGSLLGITLHQGESAPVGKVDIINMYPMTFEEFLLAIGKRQLVEILQRRDWETMKMVRAEYQKYLRQYYFVGGMPEAVSAFIDTNDATTVRRVQEDILTIYRSDMSKHAAPREVVRITQVWNSIPSQLAKENKKFVYGSIKKGARAKDYELAIQWLQDAGLVYRSFRATKPAMPLTFYIDDSAFKLYLLDIGLFGALNNIPPAQLLTANNMMEEGKGALTENYVISQLATRPHSTLCYYSAADSRLEIDFLLQTGEHIIPIEVKAEENLRSKSLQTFIEKHPALKGVRLSMSDHRDQQWMENIPLYASLHLAEQE